MPSISGKLQLTLMNIAGLGNMGEVYGVVGKGETLYKEQGRGKNNQVLSF